jgi:hypothetical protein
MYETHSHNFHIDALGIPLIHLLVHCFFSMVHSQLVTLIIFLPLLYYIFHIMNAWMDVRQNNLIYKI